MNAPMSMPDDATIERLAQQIHMEYLHDAGGVAPEVHPARREWDDLPDDLRGQNRNQARDNVVKLHRLGLVLIDASALGDRPAIEQLDDSVVEILARDEHDRWAKQKRAQGYRYGPTPVVEGPDKQHPDLVPWENLSESTRDKDRAPVRRFPEILARAGLAVIATED